MSTPMVGRDTGTLFRSLVTGETLTHDETIPCEACDERGCPHCGGVGRIEGYGYGRTANDYRVRRVEPIQEAS